MFMFSIIRMNLSSSCLALNNMWKHVIQSLLLFFAIQVWKHTVMMILSLLWFVLFVFSFATAFREKIWFANMNQRTKLFRTNISVSPRFVWIDTYTWYLLTKLFSILLQDYNKFDLPFPNEVNPIDIGIDITDVLRINDKVHILWSIVQSLIITRSEVCFHIVSQLQRSKENENYGGTYSFTKLKFYT